MAGNFTKLHAVLASGILVVPTAANLPTSGVVEGAIRYVADEDALYTYNGTTWTASSPAAGTVIGPGSSTDNAVARFNGTSGTSIQNSGVLIDDSNNVTGATSIAVTQDPLTSLQLTTKQYVDALNNGIRWKDPVRVATTVAGTLASDFENGDTIDGVILATGDRILIKDQVTGSENGIYTVNASGAPSRATDADTFTALNGAVVLAQEGTANADKGFQQTAELTSLSDNQTWIQNFGTGLYAADGQGIELSGQTFSLELDGTTLQKSASGLKVNPDLLVDTLHLNDTDSAFDLIQQSTSTLTANRILTWDVDDAARTVRLGGNLTLAANFITSGANSLTLTTTGSTNVTLPTTGTLATLAGAEVFTNKTLTAPVINGATTLSLDDSNSAFNLLLQSTSNLSADRTLTFNTNQGNRTIDLAANLTLTGSFTLAGANSTTLTATGSTNVTLPTTGTLATLAGVEAFTNKSLTAPAITGGSAIELVTLSTRDTSGTGFDLGIAVTDNTLSADRVLTFNTKNAARTVQLSGNLTLAADFITSGANSLTLTTTGSTNVTLPTTGTLATLAGTENFSNKTFTNATVVDGSADEIQLRVQGHSTQTTDIFVVEKSGGTDLLQVTENNGTHIRGTTTNDSAAAGFVGEFMIDTTPTLTNFAASGTFGDFTGGGLALTAGEWELTFFVEFAANGATFTGQEIVFGIGDVSGDGTEAALNLTRGLNVSSDIVPTADYDVTECIPSYRVSLSSTTTYYGKLKASYTGGPPQYRGRLQARRIR